MISGDFPAHDAEPQVLLEFCLKDGTKGVIRTAVPQDADTILNIKLGVLADGIYDALLPEEYAFDAQQEALWIEQSLGSSSNLLLVADVGKVVGVLYFQTSSELRCSHWGELGMGLEPAWRGKGLGTYLVQSLLAWATEHPRLEKVVLKVFAANARAHKLYERLGFVEEGRLRQCLRLGPNNYTDAILMAAFVKEQQG